MRANKMENMDSINNSVQSHQSTTGINCKDAKHMGDNVEIKTFGVAFSLNKLFPTALNLQIPQPKTVTSKEDKRSDKSTGVIHSNGHFFVSGHTEPSMYTRFILAQLTGEDDSIPTQRDILVFLNSISIYIRRRVRQKII